VKNPTSGNDSPCWYVSHEASQHSLVLKRTLWTRLSHRATQVLSRCARFDLFNTSISSNTVVNAANVSIYCSEFVPVDTSSRDRIFRTFSCWNLNCDTCWSRNNLSSRHCTNVWVETSFRRTAEIALTATTDKLIFVYFLQNFVGLSESRAYTLHRVCFRPRVHQRSWSQNYQRSDFHVRCGQYETIPTAIDANIALSIVCIMVTQIKLSNHDMNDTKLWYMRWFRRNF
jgi:hypothetical protein